MDAARLDQRHTMFSASPIMAAFQRGAQQRARKQADSCNTPNDAPATDGTEHTPADAPDYDGQSRSLTEKPRGDGLALSRRAPQHVLTRAQRAQIVSWMMRKAQEDGEKNLFAKTIANFPQLFRSSREAAFMKAMRLWRQREIYVNAASVVSLRGTASSLTRTVDGGRRRVNMKALPGRGRKRSQWVIALQDDMRVEFDRLRRLGVKFNYKTLEALARYLITHSDKSVYNANTEENDVRIVSKIDKKWIQRFCDRFTIVSRRLTGKHCVSRSKQDQIEKEVAYHLGQLAKGFREGLLDENNVENADETHFVINVDNGRTLGFSGEEDVKYADVVSGGEGMTMLVRLTGGRNGCVAAPFLVFQNKDRRYPIRGVADDIEGVSYRTGPKGWMDTVVMPQWLREPRAIRKLQNDRKRVLFVDNCSGHNATAELETALHDINTEIRYFPKNATDLVQPCDSFIIQKIKLAWSTRWEAHKMSLIQSGMWRQSSGKLPNPGKRFFLRLAADAVRDVNAQRDENGLSFAYKAMIRTGMALNVTGRWEEAQLFPRLQQIIAKHRKHFDGEPVDSST